MWDHLGRVLGRGEGLWVLEQDYGSSLAPPPLKAGVGGYIYVYNSSFRSNRLSAPARLRIFANTVRICLMSPFSQ